MKCIPSAPSITDCTRRAATVDAGLSYHAGQSQRDQAGIRHPHISRLITCDRSGVTFRWKDYRAEGRDRQKVMSLATGEFIRRFLIHVLPQGFHRIRHYGLLASGTRADNIAQARRLLDVPAAQPEAGAEADEPKPLSHPCPCCGGRMIIIETFQRGCSPRYRPAATPTVIRIDTS